MDLKSYKTELQKKELKTINELHSHLVTYIAVNLGLFLLNMMTSSGYPWFLFVVGGWGIGVASHWGERLVAFKNLQDINDNPNITDTELENLIIYHKSRKNFMLHIISNASVAIYLLMINLLTSSGFMWSFIPIIGMAVGVASHWGQFSRHQNRERISTNIYTRKMEEKINPQLESALKLKESIIEVIDGIRYKFKNFASDLLPKIDNYVDTIELLTKKEEDLNNSLEEVNEQDLLNEKSDMIAKQEKSESKILIQEYDKLIKDIDKHLATIEKIKEQKEILGIKITTSINSLKHLKLELISLSSNTTLEDSSILDDFTEKSLELAQYYKDLLESYDDLYRK